MAMARAAPAAEEINDILLRVRAARMSFRAWLSSPYFLAKTMKSLLDGPVAVRVEPKPRSVSPHGPLSDRQAAMAAMPAPLAGSLKRAVHCP